MKTQKPTESMAMAIPSAASGVAPRRPTKAVSTRLTSGSASIAPRAGTASRRMDRSCRFIDSLGLATKVKRPTTKSVYLKTV